MDFIDQIFGSEINELKNHVKTEEEIKKYCTNEDFTELKRAVHLMKKGYEIQKISVINNLDKYLNEVGANEELLALIIESMLHWDDKMQIECANSFVQPIKKNLIENKNKQKILKITTEIIASDDNATNEKLTDAFFNVFDVLVEKVELDFAIKQIFPDFMELCSLKNQVPKRKRGNKLVSSFARQVGEAGFDKEPMVIKIIMEICHNNNYKIRMDGVLFFKEYLQNEKVRSHSRFKDLYIPEIIELLNDEEAYIRIEALEIMTEYLSFLDEDEIEKEYIQAVLKTMDVGIEEIVLKLAQMIGKIVYSVKPYGFHIKYQEQFIEFYKTLQTNKEVEMRRHGAYNLACFNSMYKDSQSELGIDFQDIYLKYSREEDPDILKTVAASVHEAFQLTTQDEDTQKLRDTFKNLVQENNKDVIIGISENIEISIQNYCNDHAIKNYVPKIISGSGQNSTTPVSKGTLILPKGSTQSDFTSVISTKNSKEEKKGLSQKKITTPAPELNKDMDEQSPTNYQHFLPEYHGEIVYSDLLNKLMIFDQNLQNQHGLWRSQIKYLYQMSKVVQLFNIPELHEAFLPSLFDYIKGGNSQIRQAAAECLSKILQYQYSSAKRVELIAQIKTGLAESSSCVLRKTYIYFCKSSVNCFSRQFFKTYFLQPYLAMSTDKVATVRMEFAHSVVHIKPFIDNDVNLNLELMDILNHLKADSDRDVQEAVEHCDYQLLQQRKKSKEEEKQMMDRDQERSDLETRLLSREAKVFTILLIVFQEEEERKKKMEEEEEQKFDFQTLLAESSRKFKKGKFNPFSLNRKGFGVTKASGTSLIGAKGTSTTPGGSASSTDKTPLKKKSTMNPSASKDKTGTSSLLKPPVQPFEKKATLGVNGDIQKRHSVLITSQSKIDAGGFLMAPQIPAAKGTGTKPYGRKGSTLGANE